jgi:hypothetical protein
MWRCIELQQANPNGMNIPMQRWSKDLLEQAYSRCAEVTSEYAKTFYLGTQLMTPQQAKAIWAIYVWCRRTDELVDGPNASRITPKVCCGNCIQQQQQLQQLMLIACGGVLGSCEACCWQSSVPVDIMLTQSSSMLGKVHCIICSCKLAAAWQMHHALYACRYRQQQTCVHSPGLRCSDCTA